MYERLTSLQEGIIPKKKAATDDDLHRINELIQVKAYCSLLQFGDLQLIFFLNLNGGTCFLNVKQRTVKRGK